MAWKDIIAGGISGVIDRDFLGPQESEALKRLNSSFGTYSDLKDYNLVTRRVERRFMGLIIIVMLSSMAGSILYLQ